MHLYSKNRKKTCGMKNIEVECNTPGLRTGTVVVKCAIQTPKNSIIVNLEDKTGFTENVNQILTVMRFTTNTGLKVAPFELHYGG